MLQYIVSLYILFLTSFLHIFLWIINSYLALIIYYTIRQWQCLEISCIVDNKRNFKENNFIVMKCPNSTIYTTVNTRPQDCIKIIRTL